MATGRAWLDVPYDEKDEAKALGAKWDPQARRWYAPQPGSPKLARWAPLPNIQELLPGEDRTFGSGLFVDLVPSSCWFTNVRSCTTKQDWERLRRMIVGRAKRRCEACGRGEDRHLRRWLEAHERWAYDEQAGTQTLRRLLCLCTDCHRVTHFGLTILHGMPAEALAHLRAVTGMSEDQASAHVRDAFAIWRRRSSRDWALDLGILTSAGIAVIRPPQAAERAGIADQVLSVTLGVRLGQEPMRSRAGQCDGSRWSRTLRGLLRGAWAPGGEVRRTTRRSQYGELDGSSRIGARYRHTTDAMAAWVVE